MRNLGLVAKMAATLDQISGGRAILGLGAAWYEEEHLAHGIPFGAGFDERIRWLDESLGLIRRLLAGDVADYESEHYQFRHVREFPCPVQIRERELDRVVRTNQSTSDQIRNAWVGPPGALAERTRAYLEIGFRNFIVELPAPFDTETLDDLIGEVLPMAEA